MAKKKRKPHVPSSLEEKFLGLWHMLAKGTVAEVRDTILTAKGAW